MREFSYSFYNNQVGFKNGKIYLSDEAYREFISFYNIKDEEEVSTRLVDLILNSKPLADPNDKIPILSDMITYIQRQSDIYIPLIYKDAKDGKLKLYINSEQSLRAHIAPETISSSLAIETPSYQTPGLAITSPVKKEMSQRDALVAIKNSNPRESDEAINETRRQLITDGRFKQTLELTPTLSRKSEEERHQVSQLNEQEVMQKAKALLPDNPLFDTLVNKKNKAVQELKDLEEKESKLKDLSSKDLPETLAQSRDWLLKNIEAAKKRAQHKIDGFNLILETINAEVSKYEKNESLIKEAKLQLARIIYNSAITYYNKKTKKSVQEKVDEINKCFRGLITFDQNLDPEPLASVEKKLLAYQSGTSGSDLDQIAKVINELLGKNGIATSTIGTSDKQDSLIDTLTKESSKQQLPFTMNVKGGTFAWNSNVFRSRQELKAAIEKSVNEQASSYLQEDMKADQPIYLFNNNYEPFQRDLTYYNNLRKAHEDAKKKEEEVKKTIPQLGNEEIFKEAKADSKEAEKIIDAFTHPDLVHLEPFYSKLLEARNTYNEKIQALQDKIKIKPDAETLSKAYPFIPYKDEDSIKARNLQLGRLASETQTMKVDMDAMQIKKEIESLGEKYKSEVESIQKEYTIALSTYQQFYNSIHDSKVMESFESNINIHSKEIEALEKTIAETQDPSKFKQDIANLKIRLQNNISALESLKRTREHFDSAKSNKNLDHYESIYQQFHDGESTLKVGLSDLEEDIEQIKLQVDVETLAYENSEEYQQKQEEKQKRVVEEKQALERQKEETATKVEQAVQNLKVEKLSDTLPVMSKEARDLIVDTINIEYLEERKGFLNFVFRKPALTRHKKALAESLRDIFADENRILFINQAKIISKAAAILNYTIEQIFDKGLLDTKAKIDALKNIYKEILNEVATHYEKNPEEQIAMKTIIESIQDRHKNATDEKNYISMLLMGSRYGETANDVTNILQNEPPNQTPGKKYFKGFSSGLELVLNEVIDIVTKDDARFTETQQRGLTNESHH
ncbi:hypothetical protein [Aquicella lusitana]|uniref:Uncharacterized protein n=1 Tax=Aquicella lusitana TaxID=254246 RepID=A0A370GEL2_9COXI|nr:hypothetical protein [Aquicella lusitana]RDI41700.1 hypothetical protein C8D86_11823 [Aquicella lusitana]VVC72676.1 hypothetical protein AQULUS_03900 [Aquicella lusitana]